MEKEATTLHLEWQPSALRFEPTASRKRRPWQTARRRRRWRGTESAPSATV